MGHRINPLIFRLGYSNNWRFNMKERKNWITSQLVYQLVSNQILKYTLPRFNRDRTRNIREEPGLIEMFGESQIRENTFKKKSILFSHLLIGSKNSNLEIRCYFFDYKFKFRNRDVKFYQYNQRYSNVYFKWRDKNHFFKKRFRNKYNRKLSRWFRYMTPSLWLFNLNNKSCFFVAGNGNKNYFDIAKVWIRLFGKVYRLEKKQKTFFVNVLYFIVLFLSSLANIFKLETVKTRFSLMAMAINLYNYKRKLLAARFHVDLFRRRYITFKSITKSISNNLKEMIPEINKMAIKYLAIRERSMTSALLTNLILTKLGQYYRINSIVYPLLSWIKRHRNVLGYRIMVSGRLTRRERATHMVKGGRAMPLSTVKYKIDYNQDIKLMKFGMVGIKVYLFVRKKMRTSYYFFNFSL